MRIRTPGFKFQSIYHDAIFMAVWNRPHVFPPGSELESTWGQRGLLSGSLTKILLKFCQLIN